MRRCSLLAVVLVACSPSASEDDSESTGDGSGTACVPEPQGGVDPFGDAPTCEALLERADGARVVDVRIVNATNRGIGLVNRTSGCNQPARRFDVTGTAGGRELHAVEEYCPTDWHGCTTQSDDFQACQSCNTLHHHVYIEPGGWFDEPWDAWVIGDVVLPGPCVGEDADIACAAATVIPAGSFTITAHAAPVDNGDIGCECEPDANGSCYAEPDCALSPSLTAVTTYDGICDALEITFTSD